MKSMQGYPNLISKNICSQKYVCALSVIKKQNEVFIDF